MKCQYCGGAVVLEKAYGPYPARLVCLSCGREVKPDFPKKDGEDMSYHLKPEKEEEVKALLRDNSIRDIIAKTGVAYNTVKRIRNENLTAEERAEFKRQAMVRGALERGSKKIGQTAGLQKEGRNIPKIIPSSEKTKEINKAATTKICPNPTCKMGTKLQPLENFTKNRTTPDGLERWCRACKNEAAQTRYDQKTGKTAPKKPTKPIQKGAGATIIDTLTIDARVLQQFKKNAVIGWLKGQLAILEKEDFT